MNNILIFHLIFKLCSTTNLRVNNELVFWIIFKLNNGLIDVFIIERIEFFQRLWLLSRSDYLRYLKEVKKESLIFGITGIAIGSFVGLAIMGGGLISGLIGGLIGGLIFEIIGFILLNFVIIIGLTVGIRQELKVRSYPNQGTWNSFLYSMYTAIVTFLLIALISMLFHAQKSLYFSGLSLGLLYGYAAGGGKACLQHLSLRIVLWQSGLPWNFARFLKYCVERRLLLRVGGSYRFLHRELLDHFAQLSR
jgi:hypothetical protein